MCMKSGSTENELESHWYVGVPAARRKTKRTDQKRDNRYKIIAICVPCSGKQGGPSVHAKKL